jgi:hypothetical protein
MEISEISGVSIIEVINGRLKGVVDSRHPFTGAELADLVASGVDDITIRPRSAGEDMHKHFMRSYDAERYLAGLGWVQWEIDKCVWLRPGGRYGKQK